MAIDLNHNENMQTPSIEQIQKTARDIYYKEHEFIPDYTVIIEELDELLKADDDENPSIITIKKREIQALLEDYDKLTLDALMVINDKIQLLLGELISIDSAYERLYQKIFNDIEIININIVNHIQAYNIPETYSVEMRQKIFSLFRKKSAYLSGEADGSNQDIWTIRTNGIIQLRDMDMSDRMITFPINIDPSISQESYIKLLEFTPLLNIEDEPVFLAEIIISGDLYSFKGYLKSEELNKKGKRGAVFNAEYAVSHEIPFSFKVVYDDTHNKILILFKYDDTANKFTSIIRLDFSVHLLVGQDLKIENPNNLFEEEIAV
jgi:hypothetical protein